MPVIAAVDAHMVGQPSAGDAGNARFHTLLIQALMRTATDDDRVAALIAHEEARELIGGETPMTNVAAGNARRLCRDIPQALRDLSADAAVFSYIAPPRSPCPSVVVVHDVVFRLRPDWFSRRVRSLLNTMVPLSVRRAGAVVTVSERSREDLVDAFDVDPSRVHVVPNIPAPAFTPREDAAARVAERHGLYRYCLYVGDVHPRKNLVALAEAIRLVGDRDLRLAVVGRAGHQGEELIAASGGMWLGPMGDEELADLYSAAAVTCYPSLYEGFGLPVVEAMACGSPVVAADRGAIPEVAGDAAILVEPYPAPIADGIRAALEPMTADRLREDGLRRAATFSPESMGAAGWAAIRAAVA